MAVDNTSPFADRDLYQDFLEDACQHVPGKTKIERSDLQRRMEPYLDSFRTFFFPTGALTKRAIEVLLERKRENSSRWREIDVSVVSLLEIQAQIDAWVKEKKTSGCWIVSCEPGAHTMTLYLQREGRNVDLFVADSAYSTETLRQVAGIRKAFPWWMRVRLHQATVKRQRDWRSCSIFSLSDAKVLEKESKRLLEARYIEDLPPSFMHLTQFQSTLQGYLKDVELRWPKDEVERLREKLKRHTLRVENKLVEHRYWKAVDFLFSQLIRGKK